jgi:Domain of unknown function (DUF4372)
LADCNSVFLQLLKIVGRHEFEAIASLHHQSQRLRKTRRWAQFIAMAFAQLSGRQSLRDIETNLQAHPAGTAYDAGSVSAPAASGKDHHNHCVLASLASSEFTRNQG